MRKTIVVCGHGPGISDAVARRFGRDGFSVAIVARNAERLTKDAARLGAVGIEARGFPCNLGDPDAVRALFGEIRAALGPITAVHWNAYASGQAGDLVTATTAELRANLDLAVLGLVAAAQSALPDLKAAKGSLLVTGGGLGSHEPAVTKMTVDWGAMGLGIAKAAQHKTTSLLALRLAREGVFVGEVVVTGIVKGTAFDTGNGTLDANDIAAKFWELHAERAVTSVTI